MKNKILLPLFMLVLLVPLIADPTEFDRDTEIEKEINKNIEEKNNKEIDNIIESTNAELSKQDNTEINYEQSKSNTTQTSNINVKPNKQIFNNPIVSKPMQLKNNINKFKKAKIAVDKEREGTSQYKSSTLKYVATKDGTVIEKYNEKQKHPIASLTKVMNILVALDAVDKGEVSLKDKVCFDQKTVNIGGSWLNVSVGDCFSLEDLLRSEIIYSANNAAYLVAYHVGKGNLDNFVQRMNEKAKQFGMNDTTFNSPAGLPPSMTGRGIDVSTPSDLFLMAKAALSDKRIMSGSSELNLVFIKNDVQIVYPNRNKLLGKYGINGLKTGFHEQAGYNMIVTSKNGNIEIISVILGAKTEGERIKEQEKIFSSIMPKIKKLYEQYQNMGKFTIKYAKKKEITGILSEEVYQYQGLNYEFEIVDMKKSGGIKKGDEIGKLVTKKDGVAINAISIVSTEDVKELNWFSKLIRFITFGWI